MGDNNTVNGKEEYSEDDVIGNLPKTLFPLMRYMRKVKLTHIHIDVECMQYVAVWADELNRESLKVIVCDTEDWKW